MQAYWNYFYYFPHGLFCYYFIFNSLSFIFIKKDFFQCFTFRELADDRFFQMHYQSWICLNLCKTSKLLNIFSTCLDWDDPITQEQNKLSAAVKKNNGNLPDMSAVLFFGSCSGCICTYFPQLSYFFLRN